jgi:predicted dehydrogenase/nucleoside-diphosphate-sugar epimerase
MTSDNKQQRTLRIGIVGCGRVAEFHARAVQSASNAQLVGVADLNGGSAQRFANEHKITNVCSSLEELLSVCKLDAVHIVTPPAYHYELAKAAIERGVSVFVEKPVAFNAWQVSELYDRAVEKRVLLCPDFIQIFHPTMIRALHLLEVGRLGRVVHVESHMYIDRATVQQAPELYEATGLHWTYRLPGGLLHNYISHPLYMALYFAGRFKSLSVTGRAHGSLPQELVDHLAVQIDGEKCSASVVLSLVSKPADQDIRLYCENGTVYVNFDSRTLLVDCPGSLPAFVNHGIGNYLLAARLSKEATRNIWSRLRGRLTPYGGMHVLASRFYDSILASTEPPISRDLTVDVVRAEELIFEQSGKLQLDTRRRDSRQVKVKHPERVLATGAAGYVGFHVVKKLLDANYYVRVLVRPTSRIDRLEELGVEVIFGDVRRPEDISQAADGMDVIVHMAAVNGRPKFMVDTAVDGIQNVARAARLRQVKRVIYISSMSIYDYTKNDGSWITEDSPLDDRPELRGSYTLAKSKAECIALAHLSDQSPAWTILRPSLVVGRGRDLATAVGKRFGQTLVCLSAPSKRLRLIHVEDVADAVREVLRNKNTESRIFTVSHAPVRLSEYINQCVRSIPQETIRVVYVPYFCAWMGAKVLGVLRKTLRRGNGINQRQLSYLYSDVGADSASLGREIGWQPRQDILKTLATESTSRLS